MASSIFEWLMGKPRIVIEPAREGDYRELARIHEQGFARGWSDGEFESLLSQQAFSCLVARNTGAHKSHPVGFVITKTVADEAEIITIAVGNKWRGRGIARQLMDSAIRKLQADRIPSLYLEVDEGNQPAIALYRKLGFTDVSQRESYYQQARDDDSNPATALVMLRQLG